MKTQKALWFDNINSETLKAKKYLGCIWIYLDVSGCIWMYLGKYLVSLDTQSNKKIWESENIP